MKIRTVFTYMIISFSAPSLALSAEKKNLEILGKFNELNTFDLYPELADKVYKAASDYQNCVLMKRKENRVASAKTNKTVELIQDIHFQLFRLLKWTTRMLDRNIVSQGISYASYSILQHEDLLWFKAWVPNALLDLKTYIGDFRSSLHRLVLHWGVKENDEFFKKEFVTSKDVEKALMKTSEMGWDDLLFGGLFQSSPDLLISEDLLYLLKNEIDIGIRVEDEEDEKTETVKSDNTKLGAQKSATSQKDTSTVQKKAAPKKHKYQFCDIRYKKEKYNAILCIQNMLHFGFFKILSKQNLHHTVVNECLSEKDILAQMAYAYKVEVSD